MPKSTKTPAARNPDKPAKPHPDFPLFPHATKRWAKKVRGKLHYFGPWAEPEKALELWLAQKDDLLAGMTPTPALGKLTIRDLVNHFLTAKKRRVDTGELAGRSFFDYHATCERVIEVFGRTKPVDHLSPSDFDKLRSKLAEGRGPTTFGNDVQRVKVLFKHGFDAGLIDRPVRFGADFKKPSAKTLRKQRQAKGPRMFEAADLRRIIGAAGVPLKAMILLGINAGFGNNDIAKLPMSAVNLETGWLDFPRPKTAVHRRCWLWPETVKALRAAISERPNAKNPADAWLVFVTKYGARWSKGDSITVEKNDKDGGAYTIKGNTSNPLSHEFAKLLTTLGIKRNGLNFYALRHVFATIAGESRDQVAVNAIMGHAPASNDMASVYRERISDDRLQAVSEFVRQWLLTNGRTPDEKQPEGGWTLA